MEPNETGIEQFSLGSGWIMTRLYRGDQNERMIVQNVLTNKIICIEKDSIDLLRKILQEA